MAVDIHSEDGQIIRQLIPFSTLSSSQFIHLCKLITIEEAKSDIFLFKRKDTIDDFLFLLKGTIILQGDHLKIEEVVAGTESSKFAIAHQMPRKIDAYTKTKVRFFTITNRYLDHLPTPYFDETGDQASYFDANNKNTLDEGIEEEDGLSKILESDVFRALSPVNLQQVMLGLGELLVKKDDVIIKQGEVGECFYIILKGECLVTHSSIRNGREIKLEMLGGGEGFGEESLLSGEPSNIEVTAQTDVVLYKISKENFISSVIEPSLEYISFAKISEENSALLLDVRPANEYAEHHLQSSVNLPFFMIRTQVKQFDRNKTIFVICADGKRSEAVAFLLHSKGLNALVVENGMEKEFQRISFLDNIVEPEVIEEESLFEEQELSDTSEISTHEALYEEDDKEDIEFQLTIPQLRETIQQLTDEKNEWESKYHTLFKQTEKLKAILAMQNKTKERV